MRLFRILFLLIGVFFFFSGARGCQRLQPLASSSETPLIGCVSLAWLWISAFCLNLTTLFSSRGLLPVTHLFDLSALIVLSCLLITMWQLIKAHGVTRNEPKIHGICYIILKVNIITWLEFELAYNGVTDQHINHYTMNNPSNLLTNWNNL